MKLSQNGRRLLAEWEGTRRKVYFDSGGKETIGIGHLITDAERISGTILIGNDLVPYKKGLTEAQCLELLGHDLTSIEALVSERIKVKVNQNQFDALVSLAYNIGINAFKHSTLLKVLNAHQYENVPAQLRKWVRVNGKTVHGLVTRRENEIMLWNSASQSA